MILLLFIQPISSSAVRHRLDPNSQGIITISVRQNDTDNRTVWCRLTVFSRVHSRMCPRRSNISTRHLRNRFKLSVSRSYILWQWHISWLLVTLISRWRDINNLQCHDAAPTASSFKRDVRITIFHVPFKSHSWRFFYCECFVFEPDIFRRFWVQDLGFSARAVRVEFNIHLGLICVWSSIINVGKVIYRLFTTLGHNCRRWFPRSLWSKKVHINMFPILDSYGVMTVWNSE